MPKQVPQLSNQEMLNQQSLNSTSNVQQQMFSQQQIPQMVNQQSTNVTQQMVNQQSTNVTQPQMQNQQQMILQPLNQIQQQQMYNQNLMSNQQPVMQPTIFVSQPQFSSQPIVGVPNTPLTNPPQLPGVTQTSEQQSPNPNKAKHKKGKKKTPKNPEASSSSTDKSKIPKEELAFMKDQNEEKKAIYCLLVQFISAVSKQYFNLFMSLTSQPFLSVFIEKLIDFCGKFGISYNFAYDLAKTNWSGVKSRAMTMSDKGAELAQLKYW